MRLRFLLFLDGVRSSYWLIPTLMLLASGGMAFGLIVLDQQIDNKQLVGYDWIFSGGADGARSILSTIAGSVIGVAGTTFSITIAVLSLTSSQFGPRLLRGFLRDRANQAVLGTFVGTFLYCLLVSRTVRSMDETVFVPHLAVTGGLVLAVASVGVLIFFINHVIQSIQASHIIGNVADELKKLQDDLYPDEIAPGDVLRSVDGFAFPEDDPATLAVRSREDGYLEAVDADALFEFAKEKRWVIKTLYATGDFVVRGAIIAHVFPGDAGGIEDVTDTVCDAFEIGAHRTAAQDSQFLMQQLVEIAVRALSPGVNDPFTAITCIDKLGAALCHLSARRLPTPERCDDTGRVRLVTPKITLGNMMRVAFDGIYHYGKSDPQVLARLHETLRQIGDCAPTEEKRNEIKRAALRYKNAD